MAETATFDEFARHRRRRGGVPRRDRAGRGVRPVPGSLVTISVEAERVTGDWFVAFPPPKE